MAKWNLSKIRAENLKLLSFNLWRIECFTVLVPLLSCYAVIYFIINSKGILDILKQTTCRNSLKN